MAEPGGGIRVLIAGGGVAGLEAALALSRLGPAELEVELLDPSNEFVYRPLLVAEPFGAEGALRFSLSRLAHLAGAHLRRDALAEVEPRRRVATTAGGVEIPYDFLLLALGARPEEAVPGAIPFGTGASAPGFDDLLRRLGRSGWRRIAFVVPPAATWTIAAYELAMLTAAERSARHEDVELLLVTHEPQPLGAFGAEVASLLASKLAEAGVELRCSTRVTGFRDGQLATGGEPILCDRAVALPRLEVDRLPGVPHGHRGFVDTDVQMQVVDLSSVWAAGDMTGFPVKQGGLAAQQADIAARAIAVRAGSRLPLEPYRPVLRAELITGAAPEFLRASRAGSRFEHSREPLWWPPEKIAARYLGPLLAAESEGIAFAELIDLDPPDDPGQADAEDAAAVSLLLAAADSDARAGEYAKALGELALVERLDLVLPPEYVARRERWRRAMDPGVERSVAAGRIDPTLIDARAAISDIEHRIGRLREHERLTEAAMNRDLSHLDEGMDQLRRLSRETGLVPKDDRT